MKALNVALAGNPNVGKTTVFNALTGSRQKVGNWPGKTVEQKTGYLKHKGRLIKIIDLPGTYSMNYFSMEEKIARDYIINEKPDVVIHVVNSCDLERNLFLTIQLLEMGAKVIVALNMSDVAQRRCIRIDEEKFSRLLGIPAVKIQANKKRGIEKLLDAVIEYSAKRIEPKIKYDEELETHISKVEDAVKKYLDIPEKWRPRWVAIKLLEKDAEILEKLGSVPNFDIVSEEARRNREHLRSVYGKEIDTIFIDAAYGFISGLVKEVAENLHQPEGFTDRIDRVVTHKYAGIPIFLAMMLIVFSATFIIAQPISDAIGIFFSDILSGIVRENLSAVGAPQWFISFLTNGVINGVGSVIVFVPFIFMLFFSIALLEDSGYMARAAYVMDRIMHKLGLHGKSFIPMILGFGCTVPAVMASRMLEDRKDKIVTVLVTPFMSCGAKLPVYVLIAAALFPRNTDIVVFSLYVIGIIMAIIMAFVLNRFFFKGLSSPFVIELPPYRVPTITGALIHMWERGWLFIKKAGTIIFSVVVFIWFLASMPFGVQYASEGSFIGLSGKVIAPVFSPLGFGEWKISVSLLMGVVAKESIIGTLGTLYGTEITEADAGFSEFLKTLFTPASAYAFLLFVLLYIPCISSLATIKREIGTKWMLFTVVYTFTVAWVVAFGFYNAVLMLGLG